MTHSKKTLKTYLITTLLSLTLFACAQDAEDPKTVADKYWHYMQTGNTLEAEKLVSTSSRRAFLDKKDQLAPIETLNNDDTIATVKTTITTLDANDNVQHTQTFDTILVLQQGQWKIDADRTKVPLSPSAREAEMKKLSEDLSESMQENIESIDEAMNQGMQMLNEVLQESSKEMGDTLLQLMNELNSSMKESIENMKQRRQEQQQQELLQPDPEKGEGKI